MRHSLFLLKCLHGMQKFPKRPLFVGFLYPGKKSNFEQNGQLISDVKNKENDDNQNDRYSTQTADQKTQKKESGGSVLFFIFTIIFLYMYFFMQMYTFDNLVVKECE